MISSYNAELIIEPGAARKAFERLLGTPYILHTTKTPYKLISPYLNGTCQECVDIYSNSIDDILNLCRNLSSAKSIVAVGGGKVLDVGKVVSHKTKLPLIAIPSALSCNGFATNKSVVKAGSLMKTIDASAPETVIIDTELLSKAEPRFNRVGIADVASTYTALFDWKLARNHAGERQDYVIENVAGSLVDVVKQNYKDVMLNNNMVALAEMLLFAGYITNLYGSGRPESGSEHMVARAIEEHSVFGPQLIHGEAVQLGILLCSELQGQENSFAYDIARIMGLPERLGKVSMSEQDISALLLRASKIRPERYCIFNRLDMNDAHARRTAQTVLRRLGHE